MEIRFCDQCDASIPELDVDRAVAARLEGRLLCSLCLPRARRNRLLAMALQPLLLLAAVALGAALAVYLTAAQIEDLNGRVSALTSAAEEQPRVDPAVGDALAGLEEVARALAENLHALETSVAERDRDVAAAHADTGEALAALRSEIREIRECLAAAAETAAPDPAPVAADPVSPPRPVIDLATWLPLAVDPDAGVRLSALVALEPARDPRVLGAARSALTDGDPVVRAQAIRMVADRGDLDSVPALVTLLEDGNARVRGAAHRALESITGLGLAFDTTDSEEARKSAIAAIRELLLN